MDLPRALEARSVALELTNSTPTSIPRICCETEDVAVTEGCFANSRRRGPCGIGVFISDSVLDPP